MKLAATVSEILYGPIEMASQNMHGGGTAPF